MRQEKSFYSGRYVVLFVIFFMLAFTNCGKRTASKLPEPPSSEFSRYISAFSGGVVPTDEPIQIQFAFEMVDSSSIGTQAAEELFRIRPSLKGKAIWRDTRTIEFRPDEKLPHDKIFNVTLRLGNLLNVKKELENFTFGVITMPQAANMYLENVQVYVENQQSRLKIKGVIETADAADPAKLRQILKLEKGFGNSVEISWIHEQKNRKHVFTIDNISRGSNVMELVLSWDGKSIDAKQKGTEILNIPAPGSFSLIHTHFEQLPEPRISLQFSEPLQQQNLSGLLYFADQKNLNTRITNNEIMVFVNQDLSGVQLLNIEASIADINGKRLGEKVLREFVFEDIKPSVRLTGRGMIIPASRDLLFPFEAVNLMAVDVDVVRIFEDNILQFLQVNQLDGDDQLRRVGRLVARRTLPLNTGSATNLGYWNRFAIDMAEVIDPEPGAIYRVYISFKKEYSLYPCSDGYKPQTVLSTLDTQWEIISDEVRYWGAYDDYEYYYDYDWRERDNPCQNTYYQNKTVTRNILASNLGIIAKKQTDGHFHFAVTDLLTTASVPGASIALYNFQQQLLEAVITDGYGFASIQSRGIPFVAVVSKDAQRAYLRVDDGASLSLSMFDVDGAKVQKGLKGFIYGERGVWRPGDTLFLNFILEDRFHTLPENYPVVFQLYNPIGQLVHTAVNKQGINGFYHFKAITSPDAPTGNYTGAFKLGGTEFTRSLRIETVMPNRLRINTRFEGNVLLGYTPGQGSLRAEWLHGGTARNLRAEVTATLSPARTAFVDFKDFVFDDPTRTFSAETFPIFTGRLGATGETSLRSDINLKSRAPGMLSAAIETKVFEEGGAFSIDRFVVPFHSYRTYSGVQVPKGSGWGGMLQTDSLYNVKVINVDASGKTSGNSRLRVDVYKIGWRWWWDATDEYFGDFSAGSYHQSVHTETLNTINGAASFNFKLEYPQWGRYMVLVTDLESGHRSGDIMYFDWPSWRGAAREGRQQAAAMLTFSLDKEKYQPGDDIQITFPSSSGGRALVSIESGTGVLEKKWVETKAENTTFMMKATADMAPNAYAHITLLQPHAHTLNDLPIRLYGIMPFVVEDPTTKLEPVITMPEVLKPEQQVSITVKENQGRAMTYTLALVDEGLLDLTRFKTPDPWNMFYAREALGVKTWDMFDFVMGAFGSEFSRLLGIGGDDFIQPPTEGERATRFKPVVRHFGPFTLAKGKSQTHTFTMPQYVGSVRVMVVAGQEGAYGHAEKTVPVRQSLMALGTLPRVMGPGEKVMFPVNVFALDPSIQQVQVAVSTNEMFTIVGDRTKNVSFTEPGDQLVWFELEAPQREGVGKVSATVKSGTETVTFDVELQVRNANPRLTSAESLMLDGNKNGELSFQLSGLADTRDVMLELSSIPAINLEKRLRFLMEYPHGCTEQIISSAFPQLYLDVFTELNETDKARIQRNVESVLGQLPTRMISNGGLTTWPGSGMANEWITSFAGHFALEAQKKGFVLPPGFLDNWLRFQKDMASRWTAKVEGFGHDFNQAYRLYTLALAGQAEMGPMNRLRLRTDLSLQAQWMLAGAYQLSGQQEAGEAMVENLSTQIEPYRQFSYTYGNPDRDKAIIISVLTLLNQKEKAAFLVKELAEKFASQQWLSTQTTVFGLMAVADFYRGSTQGAGITAAFSDDGASDVNVKTSSLIYSQPLKLPQSGNDKTIRISNKSDQPLFVRVIHSGIPAAGEEIAGSQNLGLDVRFTSISGVPVDVRSLNQGTSFIAEVTVSNPGMRGDYNELALTRIFPSGWEIGNIRMDASAAAIQQDATTYEDVRDDRVNTYFDLSAHSRKTFKVLLTATYEGRFYLPGFNVEAMYDASVYARNKGMWVEVKRE